VTTATPVTPTGSGAAGSTNTTTTGTSSGGAVVPPVKVVTAPAAPTAGTTQYTIKSGDTLEGIARAQMGDGQKWQLIAAANPGLDPKALKIGQKITIPASTTTASKDKAAAPAGSSTAAPNTYTVQKGDTLIELSRKFYGNDAEWKRILEANATTLKGDAKAIAPGMKLVIPAKR
jgi:nucleoid-associated protein YgaU